MLAHDALCQSAAFLKNGKKDEARQTLIQLLKQEPDNALGWYGLHFCVDDISQKRECLQRTLALAPGAKRAKTALDQIERRERVHAAAQLLKTGQSSEAEQILRRVLAEDPDNATAWYGLHFCVDDIVQKRVCLRRALAITPQAGPVRHALERLEPRRDPALWAGLLLALIVIATIPLFWIALSQRASLPAPVKTMPTGPVKEQSGFVLSTLPTPTLMAVASPTQAQPAATAQPQPTRTAFKTATLRPTPASSPTATLPPLSRPVYRMEASFNYPRHFLVVTETIDYPNHSGQELEEIEMAVEPNYYPGAFKLNRLQAGMTSIDTYALKNNRLQFSLPAPLAAGQVLRLTLQYELNIPAIRGRSDTIRASLFGFSNRQVNLVDWYPYIPPHTPTQGWLLHNPWSFGEHQAYEKADFEVRVTLVDSPPDLTFAAATEARVEDQQHLTFHHPNARNFTLSASQQYTRQVAQVGLTTITCYTFPEHAAGGQTALEATAQAVELYNRLFGTYPRSSLSVVEGDFYDGMEFDGLFFLRTGIFASYGSSPGSFLTTFSAHETAHQWWYASVSNDQAQDPWLDEGMATYSELLFYSEIYPNEVDWWRSIRLTYTPVNGRIDQPIYAYGNFYPYWGQTYLRGAHFLDEARQRMGESVFLEFLRAYATAYQDQIASSSDFLNLFKQYSGTGSDDLIRAYFKTSQ
jgi:tetratricopeptide (TPR) repeat protein